MTFRSSKEFIHYMQLYVNNKKIYEPRGIIGRRLLFDQAAFTKLYHELLVLQQSHILTNLRSSLKVMRIWMKKRIHRETKNGAYFVTEPEVAFTKTLTSQSDIKHILNESPDVAKRRLKYKIDRGEYDYFDAVYARKVWDHFMSTERFVPPEIVERWYRDVLSNLLKKIKEHFVEKFQVESLFQDLSDEDRILYSEEICDYLSKDVIKRAASEPLLELPKFILDEINNIEFSCGLNDT